MDALLTQRMLAWQILALGGLGGHNLMVIKKNQPTPYWAADLVFRETPISAPPGEVLRYQQLRQEAAPAEGSTPRRFGAYEDRS